MSFLPSASLIQNLPLSVAIPSTAPSKILVRWPSADSYMANLMEEEPLFRTKIGKDDMESLPRTGVAGAEALLCGESLCATESRARLCSIHARDDTKQKADPSLTTPKLKKTFGAPCAQDDSLFRKFVNVVLR